jgi:demethylmenaquinone methyltransferase/2-methoxy-6-polyprenyl-1,4-benzoquinol methylase
MLVDYYRTQAERASFVRRLFDATAADYDRVNALFSLGTGRAYRRRMLRRAGLTEGAAVLDVAGGTGLLAAEACRIVGGAGQVTALDISWGMLQAARAVRGLALVQGTAERLPLRDGRFDFVTMGYGLRHLALLETAFAEFRRVLRPGGRLLLLEIGRPDSRLGLALARLYLGRIVPSLSRAVGRSGKADLLMRYYWDTVENCVSKAAILDVLGKARFAEVTCTSDLGIFHAYSATRPQ